MILQPSLYLEKDSFYALVHVGKSAVSAKSARDGVCVFSLPYETSKQLISLATNYPATVKAERFTLNSRWLWMTNV